MHEPDCRKKDTGVPIGVAAPKVVQIDTVRTTADRHLVLERLLRKTLTITFLKQDFGLSGLNTIRGLRVNPRWQLHLLHIGSSVFLHNNFDVGWELDIPADV